MDIHIEAYKGKTANLITVKNFPSSLERPFEVAAAAINTCQCFIDRDWIIDNGHTVDGDVITHFYETEDSPHITFGELLSRVTDEDSAILEEMSTIMIDEDPIMNEDSGLPF